MNVLRFYRVFRSFERAFSRLATFSASVLAVKLLISRFFNRKSVHNTITPQVKSMHSFILEKSAILAANAHFWQARPLRREGDLVRNLLRDSAVVLGGQNCHDVVKVCNSKNSTFVFLESR